MKKFKIILIVIAILLAIGLVNRAINGKQIDKRNAERAISEVTKVNIHQSYIEKIKATEKSCKDAIITEANVLYVSVKSDGSSRKGLAEYYCQNLKDNKITDVEKVKIIAFGTQNNPKRDNAYGVLIGEFDCK